MSCEGECFAMATCVAKVLRTRVATNVRSTNAGGECGGATNVASNEGLRRLTDYRKD